MAEQVIDLIHRLSFELTGKGLDDTIRKLKEQAQGIDQLKLKEQELTQQMRKANNLNVNEMQRLSNERAKTRKLIEQETTALRQNFAANKQLQTALNQEIGIIQRLETELSRLGMARKAATSRADISAYDRQIKDVQRQLGTFTGGSKVSQLGGAVLSGLGIGAGIGLVTQGIAEVQQFAREAQQLAREAEGVKIAFERLDRPELLKSLRSATRGTVSDLNLMKQAVNFENFGLPVEKLAEAFEFARQRARDTGQSVDYLVNSITTGIARKSPLILDNLGINAKEVRDRFKETGDFAEAAFQIIAEQSEKAVVALDTFADRQERANASVENFKTEVGGFINTIKAGSLDLADNILGFFGQTDTFSEDFKRQVDLVESLLKETVTGIDGYYREYQQVDAMGKRIIENQAVSSYNELLRLQQRFFNQGQFEIGQALQGQLDQYRDFFSKLKALNGDAKIGFRNFTASDLLGMSREELKELRGSGEDELNLLSAGDTKGIAAVTRRIRQIDSALERFTVRLKVHKEKIKKNRIELQDIIGGRFGLKGLSPEDQAQVLDELDRFITKIDKKTVEFRNRRNTNAATLGREGFLSGPSGLNSVDSAGDLPDLIQIARNKREKDKNDDKIDKERRQTRIDNINAVADAYTTAAQSIAQALDIIYQAQARSLDNEIRIREQRVEAATELAERGNAELLNLERQRLEAAQEERERVARKQIAVNAALQVSNGLVAVARAASETGPYAAIAMIAAIIAALGAGYAAVQSLTADTEPGFREGVVGFKGKGTGTSDSNRVKISAGESIITAAGTEKNRAILEAINAGKVIDIPSYNIPTRTGSGSAMQVKGLEQRLDALILAQENSGVSVKQTADARGFSQVVERHTYKHQKRNRR